MKNDLDFYLNQPYKIDIIKDAENNSYVAYCPELEGCITSGRSVLEAIENLEDAKRTWLSSALEHNDPISAPDSFINFSGQIRLRIPKSLHRRNHRRYKRQYPFHRSEEAHILYNRCLERAEYHHKNHNRAMSR